MAPYLTADQMIDRLTDRFGYDAEILDGDANIASDALDGMRPFTGYKTVDTQEREFPRDAATVIPAAVLDWVALHAYELSIEHEPGVKSEGAGRVNVSYDEPKRSQLERRMDGLIGPYLLQMGERV